MSLSRILWVFILTAIAAQARGADFIQTTIQGDPIAREQIELTVADFGPADDARAAWALVEREVAAAQQSNPGAQILILCGSGGAMPPGECDGERRRLGAPEDHGADPATLSFVSLPVGGSGSDTGAPPPPAPSTAEAPEPGKSEWKGRLAVIRSISNGVVNALIAGYTKDASLLASSTVGATGGGLSGLWGYFSPHLLNWGAHKSWFTFRAPEKHEEAGPITRVAKRAFLSGIYTAGVMAAYTGLGLNPHDLATVATNWALGVGVSVGSQLPLEVVNQRWTEQAIARDKTGRAYLYRRYSNLMSFGQAMIGVIGGALSIGGGHAGLWIGGTVGTLGLLAAKWKSIPEVLRAPFEAAGRGTCRLFSRLGEVFRGRGPPTEGAP